jgi:hypothetical protein
LEEFLESLRRKAEEWLTDFIKRENEASTKMQIYLRLQTKDSSELEKVKGLVGQESLYESGDRRGYDLLLMNDLHVLAEYVNVYRALIDRLDKELEESGIREMLEDVKTIKELVETIKELKERAETATKEANKTEKEMKEKLSYIS